MALESCIRGELRLREEVLQHLSDSEIRLYNDIVSRISSSAMLGKEIPCQTVASMEVTPRSGEPASNLVLQTSFMRHHERAAHLQDDNEEEDVESSEASERSAR
eukprot:GHVU01120107.1.p1 GENE.GHVU01120107.1~~GHVU01120107.1.p1  ORF type:complete len:104 (+),score=19.29 GHVU01120107.1:658-969(+)